MRLRGGKISSAPHGSFGDLDSSDHQKVASTSDQRMGLESSRLKRSKGVVGDMEKLHSPRLLLLRVLQLAARKLSAVMGLQATTQCGLVKFSLINFGSSKDLSHPELPR
jgi:hypothetical protein